jgi:RNA polymerase sigma factor (sigma-70 family)
MNIDRVTTANAPPLPVPAETLIQRALRGERGAERRLVEHLTPTIRASVARELLLRGRCGSRAAHHEVDDITQSVFLLLFANGARALQAWDPARGRDLEGFVALLARHRTRTLLRSRRQNPWSEEPSPPEDLDRNCDQANGPESRAISRDMLAALIDGVRARLSPRGLELFELLYLEGCPTEDVCAATGLNPGAVYQWKSRLRLLVAEVAASLAASSPQAA